MKEIVASGALGRIHTVYGTATGADRAFTTAAAATRAATPPAPASFAGSKSSITVDRKGRFKFSFHATPGLTGTAVFKSVKKVRLSRKNRKTRRITLARKSFTVPIGGKVTLKIKLSKKQIAKLRKALAGKKRGLTVPLTATAKPAGGGVTAPKPVKLKIRLLP